MTNIVWILGSGFSKPLGGPTLQDLFTPEAGEDLKALYVNGSPGVPPDVVARASTNLLGAAANRARELYNCGTRWDDGKQQSGHVRGGERLWRDPEEFLDTLEAAALRKERGEHSFAVTRLETVAASLAFAPPYEADVVRLRNAARRMLAAECSKFLLEADPERSERWAPYRRWRDKLVGPIRTGNLTILTFNYDLALEKLGLDDWVRLPPATVGGGPCILKLHGSVDWKRVGTHFERVDDPHFAVTCADHELAIAPPGPAKADVVKAFAPLWTAAKDRLKHANAIVFVGYRFPPTDSEARERILESLPRGGAVAHIVLGPETNHADVVRLQALLRFRMHEKDIRVHPMWAEDFFSVFLKTSLRSRR